MRDIKLVILENGLLCRGWGDGDVCDKQNKGIAFDNKSKKEGWDRRITDKKEK